MSNVKNMIVVGLPYLSVCFSVDGGGACSGGGGGGGGCGCGGGGRVLVVAPPQLQAPPPSTLKTHLGMAIPQQSYF